MANTKSKRLVILLLIFGLMCSIIACGITGFMHKAGAEDAPSAAPTPIAEYLFDDADDIGKDSVGNYGMSVVGGNNQYTKVDGGVEFDGNFVLAQTGNNIFKDLTEFTICFEYKMLSGNGTWNSILGVSNVGDGNFMFLDSSGGDTRFHASNATKNGSDALGTCWPGAQLNCNSYTKITITVKPGGQINVYINGAVSTSEGKIPVDIAADWSLYNSAEDQCVFAIGAPVNNRGDIGGKGKAGVKELVFFDKEMTAAEVAKYWQDYDNAHAKVTAAELDFSDSITVAAAASNAHILKFAQNGDYQVSMSDGTTAAASVTWNNVVEKEGVKYLEGTISGINNPDGIKAYGKITTVTTKVKSAEVDSGAVFPATATDEQIMGAVKNGEYEVTLEDGGRMIAVITWTEVKDDNGVKYIEGTLAEVNNPDNVKAKGKVTVGSVALQPFAKYEFTDSANPGKDSMGNYDMVVSGTPTAADGVLTLDGASGLTANGFTEKLKSFSLTFTLNKPKTTNVVWAAPVAFGIDGGKWLTFNFAANNNTLRFTMSDRKVDVGGDQKGNIVNTSNECWGNELGSVTGDYAKVTLTVEVGGKCRVYFNGTEKGVYNVPEDFDFSSSKLKFTIGHEATNSGRNFEGGIKDVRLYDCALTPGQVGALETFGDTYPIDGVAYITGADVTDIAFSGGAATTETLYDSMSKSEMLEKVNAATVTATMSDGNTKTVAVNWEKVEIASGKYVLKGVMEVVGIGYTTIGRQEISYNLTVLEEVFVEVDEDLTGGAVSTDKQSAYAGDTVTFTVTADKGYEIGEVTINGEVAAGDDGVYTYTVKDEDTEITVTATFVRYYTVIAEQATNGEVRVNQTKAYNGDEITVTVTPNNGYEIEEVKVNGTAITPDGGAYKFTVSGDSTVTATFKAVQGTDPNPPQKPSEPAKKSCKSSLDFISGAAVVSAVTAAAFMFFRKKGNND